MKDISNKTPKDLLKALSEKRLALKNFRFSMSGSKAKNIKEGKNLRKEIAKILTELSVRHPLL
ncbi:MAG: 50S ribosomal protein L29 [bacterium]|nr:50S ribosomal protein L29 [bacterium]